MNKCFLVLQAVLIFGFAQPIFAQYQNVKVGNTINSYEPEEPSIVINPSNPDHILVGANMDNYYYSTDGGLTWHHGVLTSSFGVNADPCVLVDGDGNYYFFHLVPDLSRVVCQKTSSLGRNWSNGTYTGLNQPKDNDKEWAAINRITGDIYVTWAQFDKHGSTNPQDSSEILLSSSIDGGLNWSTPVKISDRKGDARGGNNSAHAPMPAVGPNNEVYVTWMSPYGLMFDKSTDGGKTWLDNDINVTGNQVYWLHFNVPGVPISPGFPIINCDTSPGVYNGNIYICWTDQRSGYNDTDVWIIKSTDGGSTWNAPIRINDDPKGRHQFFAWMTIDQANGNLYFVFYDRRNHADSKTDVYMAISEDGGNSFTNIKISEKPFTPSSNDFLGHYIGISAFNNIVRPVWTRVDNHQLSLWTAIINNISTTDEKPQKVMPRGYDIVSIYPNPYNATTNILYNLPFPSDVSLKIYDIQGKLIRVFLNGQFCTAGPHTIIWNGKDELGNEVSSGLYFLRIDMRGFSETKKMTLLK